MQLSLTTDYISDAGCPEEALRSIAQAGFTHVHWCHQWNTDFLYGRGEIAQIGRWLRELGLKLLDLHGSCGREKCWYSQREYERLAGVELVLNRIRMTAELGGASVVMHGPLLPPELATIPEVEQLRRSIDALIPDLRKTGLRLAMENMANDDYRLLNKLLNDYGVEILGLCYDCGHGNIGGRAGLDHLEKAKDRLCALHLHDNNGETDQHRIPFSGSVDFERLAAIIASSSYRSCISMESNVHSTPAEQRPRFLKDAYVAGQRLSEMVAMARRQSKLSSISV